MCSGKASHTSFNPLKLCRSANMWKGIKGKKKKKKGCVCVRMLSQIWLHLQDFKGPDVEWKGFYFEGSGIWSSLLIYPNVYMFYRFFCSILNNNLNLRFYYFLKDCQTRVGKLNNNCDCVLKSLFTWTWRFLMCISSPAFTCINTCCIELWWFQGLKLTLYPQLYLVSVSGLCGRTRL